MRELPGNRGDTNPLRVVPAVYPLPHSRARCALRASERASTIATLGLGKLHRRRGDREQAEEHLTTAMEMYREMGMTYWLEQAAVETRQLV